MVNMGGISGGPSVDECLQLCSNYTFSTIESGNCFCGEVDIKEFVDVSVESSEIFTCSSVDTTLFQISGLRDFLNVTVPITSVNVSVDPDFVVMLNQEFNLSMTTNDMTYAGYRIDFGDNSGILYTGRSYRAHAYSEVGTYHVEVMAMNEVSYMLHYFDIYVFTSVEDIEVHNDNLTATYADFNTTVVVKGGNNVTCDVTYSDGVILSLMKVNTTNDPYVFSHAYTEEGIQVQNVTCYNNISSSFNSSTIETVHPVINLTLIAPTSVIYLEKFNLTWVADYGTNVTLNLLPWGVSPGYSYLTSNLSIHDNHEFLPSVDYNDVGQYVVNVSISNIVTNTFYESVSFSIDAITCITSVSLSTLKLFYTPMENVVFNITCENGSNMDTTLNSDLEGIMFTDFIGGLNNGVYSDSHVYNFSSDGIFDLVFICNNTVSSLNDTITLNIEHPVENINLTNVYTVWGVTNLTFEVTQNSAWPTNALIDIWFGDYFSLGSREFINSSSQFLITHAYPGEGYYNMVAFIHNNVSSMFINETTLVGEFITGLSVKGNNSVVVGEPVTIIIDAMSGTNITYFVEFGDSGVFMCENYTSPFTLVTIDHTFSTYGRYVINVTAENSFSSVSNWNFTVYVQEKIKELALVGPSISKTNNMLTYKIHFLELGTDTCVVFDAGDGSLYLFGEDICPTIPEFQHLAGSYVFSNATLIEVQHTYTTANTYQVTITASNFVSTETDTMDTAILDFPCSFPIIELPGFSKNKSTPSLSHPSDTLIIRGLADVNCFPPIPVLFAWQITQLTGSPNNSGSVSLDSLPFLVIHSNRLNYGLYYINVTVSIQGYPMFTDTSFFYLEIIQSYLQIEVLGNTKRTIPVNTQVELNAYRSFDPDYPVIYIPHTISWYCWDDNIGRFESETHVNSPSLVAIGDTGCHVSAGVNGGENLVVRLPANEFSLGDERTFVVAMREGNRTQWKSHSIEIVAAGTSLLAIK